MINLSAIVILSIYGLFIIGSVGLLIYTIAKRIGEKKKEKEKHKDYKDY
ncbi:hypothetical protein [uncultured Clostridium sp.]|nr:hypothetical protein [uncultured Clostridium sp.]